MPSSIAGVCRRCNHDVGRAACAHPMNAPLPAVRGGLLALLAATLFGISTPLVQRAGTGVGAFATAALLYAGAAIVGAWLRRPVDQEAAVRRGDVRRLVL